MGPSVLQTFLALAVVLALIMGCAWLMRRIQRPGGVGGSLIQVRSQIMVGPRERIVLLEVGDQWIVTGVAQGNVRPLAVMPRPDDAPPAPDPVQVADFRNILARIRK